MNAHNTGQERTQGAKPLRPLFFAYIPQGKKKTQRHKNKQDKTREQAKHIKHRETRTKDKNKDRERKTDKMKANTQKVFYPPNSTRAQKPRKPQKARKTNKPTQTPQNALKTP